MNAIDKNIESIPKLLRTMANSTLYSDGKHDIILNEAANLIEHLAKIRQSAKTVVEENKNAKIRVI